jgi:histidinol-phosphate aminotransferase
LGALEDREFMLHSAANNASGMALFKKELTRLGIHAIPSATNFLMLVFGNANQAKQVFEGLLERGVIIRPLAATGLPNCLRVSIGTPEENEIFIQALEQVCHQVRASMEVDSYAAID